MGSPRTRALLWSSAVAFVVALRVSPSLAQDRPVATLVYAVEGGARCPDEAAFRSKVGTRLGRDPFVERAGTSVRVRFFPRGAKVVARVEIAEGASAPGVRTLEETASACDSLADAVASALATAIDPLGPATPLTPAPVSPAAPAPVSPAAPAPVPAVSAPVAPPSQPIAPPPSGPSLRLVLTAHGLVSFGVVPGAAVGAFAGIGGRYGAFSVHAEGRFEATPSAVAVTPRDRLRGVAYGGALVPCGTVRWLEGCVGLRLGAIQATSLDVARPTLTTSFAAVVLARATARLALGPTVLLRLGVEGGAPLVRTTFSVEGEPAWTAPAVQGAAFLGIELAP